MINPDAVLRPLSAADAALSQLGSGAEADARKALRALAAMVEESIRILHQLAQGAPQPANLPSEPRDRPHLDDLLEELLSKDRISAELAALVRRLSRAADETALTAKPADQAELAQQTIVRLKAEVWYREEQTVRAVAHRAVAARALDPAPHPVPAPGQRNWRRLLLTSLILAALAGILLGLCARRLDGCTGQYTETPDGCPVSEVETLLPAAVIGRKARPVAVAQNRATDEHRTGGAESYLTRCTRNNSPARSPAQEE